jgi:hypothetical protein
MHNEERLGRLIALTCDRELVPDPQRLTAIEDGLVSKLPRRSQSPRTPSWYWWALAALATTAATAWWVSYQHATESVSVNGDAAIIVTEPAASQKQTTTPAPVNSDVSSASSGQRGSESRVIYRSEPK